MKLVQYLVAILCIVVTVFGIDQSEKLSFRGYRFIRLKPKLDEHVSLLAELEMEPDFDIWNNGRGLKPEVDVVLSPKAYAKYTAMFKAKDISFDILNENIQNLIDEQERSMAASRNGNGKASILGRFGKYAEIMTYLDDVAAENPTIASTKVIGTTYENRLLKTIVLKTATAQKRIWIDCGIHSREWIAPSTCVWMIDKFIREYKANDPTTVKILNYYEIHIMPLVNPDGYEYTHTTSRMWRKNRKPNSGSSCIGVDLCRNYGYKWMTGGASDNPCSDLYAGPYADSELETIALENEILAYNGTWDAFLTFHTYGLWWFTPWGYSTDIIPDYNDLTQKAKVGADAIKAVNGLTFDIGSSANLLYVNSGPSDDWARGVANIKYSYTLELRPGQRGADSSYGFLLPESRIPLAGDETYAGVKAFLNTFF